MISRSLSLSQYLFDLLVSYLLMIYVFISKRFVLREIRIKCLFRRLIRRSSFVCMLLCIYIESSINNSVNALNFTERMPIEKFS